MRPAAPLELLNEVVALLDPEIRAFEIAGHHVARVLRSILTGRGNSGLEQPLACIDQVQHGEVQSLDHESADRGAPAAIQHDADLLVQEDIFRCQIRSGRQGTEALHRVAGRFILRTGRRRARQHRAR
jgi:hypothetical protein